MSWDKFHFILKRNVRMGVKQLNFYVITGFEKLRPDPFLIAWLK